MYGKHFQSMYTGSMLGAGADVFAVWGYVISHAVQSSVELNPVLLSHVLGMKPQEVEKAIAYLCKPDPISRNKEREGRRLVREGQYLYHVVSHAIYRNIRNVEEKREADRDRQRKHRLLRDQRDSRDRGVTSRDECDVTQSHTAVTNVTKVAHTEAYTDTEAYVAIEATSNTLSDSDTLTLSKKKSKPRQQAQAPVVLPDWIPKDLWDAYLKGRKRKPNADAQRLLIQALATYGDDAIEVLKQTIMYGWASFQPLQQENKANGEQRLEPRRTAINRQALKTFEEIESYRASKRNSGID